MKTKEEYAAFLQSNFWRKLSLECRCKAKFICYRCGMKCGKNKCQAHHVRYPDDWYQTTLDDLICLCRECHEREHGIAGNDTKPAVVKAQEKPQVFQSNRHGKSFQSMKWLKHARATGMISKNQFRRQKLLIKRARKLERLKHMNKQERLEHNAQLCKNKFYSMNCRPRLNWVNRGSSTN